MDIDLNGSKKNSSSSIDYKWLPETALPPLSVSIKLMCAPFGICRYHPSAMRPREGHHSNLLLAPIWNCPITSHHGSSAVTCLLGRRFACLLLKSIPRTAAATDAEYTLVPVHLIELYVSPSPISGGLNFNCCNLIRFEISLSCILRRCPFAEE